MVGGQHHVLAGRLDLRPAQHFPAVAVAHALGVATDGGGGFEVEVVADARANHVQAADGADAHVTGTSDGQVAFNGIAHVVEGDVAAGTGLDLGHGLTAAAAQAAVQSHQRQIQTAQGAAESHFLVADADLGCLHRGQRGDKDGPNLCVCGVEGQRTGGVAGGRAARHGHLQRQGVSARVMGAGRDALDLVGAGVQRQVAADLYRTGAADGPARAQAHGPGCTEAAQAQCVDVTHRHIRGLGDVQGATEVVGAGQLHRFGQRHRDGGGGAIARAGTEDCGRWRAIDKVKLDGRAAAAGWSGHADRETVSVGGRQPGRQTGAGHAHAADLVTAQGGGDDSGAAAGAAADGGHTGHRDGLLRVHSAGRTDAQRTAAANRGLPQGDVAAGGQCRSGGAGLDATQGHVAATAGAQRNLPV